MAVKDTNLYKQLVEKYNWCEIKCVKDGKIRTIEDISEEVYDKIKGLI